jgi:DNA-binding NtrC family response regulator
MLRDCGVRASAVLLDVNMPGPSCEATLGRIRDTAPGVPVVLSSGYSENESMARFAEYRIAGFLQKPYTAGRLVEKIAEAAASPRGAATA